MDIDFCEHKNLRLFKKNFTEFADGRSFDILRCENCGILVAYDQFYSCINCEDYRKEHRAPPLI